MKTSPSNGFDVESALTTERSALGAAILDPSGHQAAVLVAQASEGDFCGSLHRAVFRAISALVGRSSFPLEYNSVIAEMQAQGTFEIYANGWSLVSSLGEGVLLGIPMSKRVRAIRELAQQRRKQGEAAVAQPQS